MGMIDFCKCRESFSSSLNRCTMPKTNYRAKYYNIWFYSIIIAPIYVYFLLLATSCVAKKIEVLPAAAIAKVDGDEIVGIVSSASCDNSRQTLQISHTKEVTNEVGIEVAESRETNWEVRINYIRKDNGVLSQFHIMSKWVSMYVSVWISE